MSDAPTTVAFEDEGGARVTVDVEASLATDVTALFPDAAERARSADAGPSGGPGAPFVEVRSTNGGWEMRIPGAVSGRERFESRPSVLAAVEHAVCRALLAADADSVHLHASGAVVAGRGIVALGGSGAGKSSVALAWSLARWPLLGDDVVRLGRDGLLRPFRRLVKVHREVMALHGLRPEATLAHDPDQDEVWIDPRGASGWADAPAPIGLVAVLSRDGGDTVRTREITGPDALRHLLASVMETGAGPATAMDALLPRLCDVRTVEVAFGSSRDAAAELAGIARGAGAA